MEWISIDEVCRPRQWKTISMKNLKEEGYPVYGANGIIGYYDEYTHEENTIMITCRGATCGTINMSKGKSYINGNAMALDNLDEEVINTNYLYYYLLDYDFTDIISGSAQPQITRTNLSRLKIPAPPLEIQKQIVEVLDESQNLIVNRKKQIELLDDLIESIFYDMFGDPVKNDKGWEVEKIDNASNIKSLDIDEKFKDDDLVWLLNLDEIESNTGKVLERKQVRFSDLPSSIVSFNEDYVLYSKLRPYLNKLILPDKEGYATSELVPILPHKYLNKVYLFNILRSSPILKFLETHVSGAKMPRVVMKDFRNLEIPVPPIQLQNQFAEKVKAIESQKSLMEESLKLMEDNYNSLMHRAFKGQLF